MTSPIDQMTKLTQANGKFMMKLAEISGEGGEACAQIGSKTAAAFADQMKSFKPGETTILKNDLAAPFFQEMENVREHTLEKYKAAFEEWQDTWTKAWQEMPEKLDVSESFKKLFPWFPAETPAPKPKPAPRTASKTTES